MPENSKGGSMTRIALIPIAALVTTLVTAPVAAQTQGAKPQSPAAPASASKGDAPKLNQGTPPAARKRGPSMASVDARHCLQLATNMAVHQCAEKYRPR
jgi:hypothetical protein